jgi:hypothetical protein
MPRPNTPEPHVLYGWELTRYVDHFKTSLSEVEGSSESLSSMQVSPSEQRAA